LKQINKQQIGDESASRTIGETVDVTGIQDTTKGGEHINSTIEHPLGS